MSDDEHDFLHSVRDFELRCVLAELPPTGRVLDLGAGTGHQAAALERQGYQVLAIDLPSSAYAGERVHPVIDYDGRVLPVDSRTIDVVFSSNVLEHVSDLGNLLRETRRVLVPEGLAVHVLPTPAWRWWTTLSHFVWCAKRAVAMLAGKPTRRHGNCKPAPHSSHGRLRQIAATLFPARHGERGVSLTEPYFYSRWWWSSTFAAHGFEVVRTYPVGLFYTGSMVLAGRLSLSSRVALARLLGSACRVYVVRPAPGNETSSRSAAGVSGGTRMTAS